MSPATEATEIISRSLTLPDAVSGPLTAESIAGAAYVVAALLFILSLAGLSKHEKARAGVIYGITGMVIALAATIWLTLQNAWGTGHALTGLGLLVAAVAVLLASINIFGGFAVTRRMLAMFSAGKARS